MGEVAGLVEASRASIPGMAVLFCKEFMAPQRCLVREHCEQSLVEYGIFLCDTRWT